MGKAGGSPVSVGLHWLELTGGVCTEPYLTGLKSMKQIKHLGQKKKYSIIFLFYSH